MQNSQTAINNTDDWVQSFVRDLTYHPQYGWTTSAKKSREGLKLLRTTDISKEYVNWETVPTCETEPSDREKYLLHDEDILVSRAGSIGLSYFVQNPPPAVFASYLIRFRALPEKIRSKLLYYFFQSPLYWSAIGAGELGIAIPNVNATKLGEIEVSYPTSFNDQDKLIARFDYLLPKVTEIKNNIQKSKKIIQKFRQSVLSAAVTGRLTEEWREKNNSDQLEESTEFDNFPFEIPKSWNINKIEDIAEYIGGFAYKSTTFLKEGSNQVIRIGNIKRLNIFLDYSPVFIPEAIAVETQRFSVQTNDILLSMTGTKYKRDYGFACIVPEIGAKKLFLNQRVACLRLRIGIPEYLLYYLQTDYFRNYLFEGETGNVNQGNVGSTALRVIPIAFPPIKEQEEIVRRIKLMFEAADLIEKQIEISEKRTDKLTQSILAKTFRGEL